MAQLSRRCCKTKLVLGSRRLTICGKPAKVDRNGQPYCGRHDPVALERRAAARFAADRVSYRREPDEATPEREPDDLNLRPYDPEEDD